MLPENHNEFRSDTFTTPIPEMFPAIMNATVGDSVYDEDADTIKLQQKVAALTGHEDGLYCVSGTLSNQIAIRSHLFQPPHSVLCDYRGHIYVHEAGGLATLSQAMVSPVKPRNGLYLTLEDVIDNFIADGDIHAAPTKVVSLENTLHGIVYPIEEIKRISDWCRANNIRIHLDGARIWDASIATGIPLKEYGDLFDSISLCLSKGLGAPIGSVLTGSKSFIQKANHFKKQNGGGIRQCGMLAKMASIAIDENWPKLKIAHELAKEVADYARELGYQFESPVDTGFIFLDQHKNKIDPKIISELGEKYQLKIAGFRISFSFQTSREAVDSLKLLLKEAWDYAQEHPYDATSRFGMYHAKN
ncbi:hypothetical protein DAMA08_030600 [Martiniozyma asiatica (nom. inval.)]|nr:hypothetical protein DAMA08_030600 [Martiniozyma asiatica]